MESITKDPGKCSPIIYYNDDTNTSSIPTSPKAEYYNRQYILLTHMEEENSSDIT
jgi:hypothetical protein